MKRTTIGGQAVMEGVMMKNMDRYAVCVRKPDKEIAVKTDVYESVTKRHAICRLPIIRGVVSFAESLYIGMTTLTYSASFYEDEESTEPDHFEMFLKKMFGEKADDVLIGFTMVLSVILAVGIFMLLPFFAAHLLESVIPSYFVRNLIEGVIRVSIFLLYVRAISVLEEISRVFMYHGAEHKTINCLEAGEELTPANVMKYSRLHKRCGTSFLLIVMVISIIVFMFIRVDVIWMKVLLRIALVPVIAGIAFEFIRLAGKSDNKIVAILSKPGLCLQYLTTKEPTEDMVEVAIASVDAVFDWRAYQEAMRNGEIED